MNISFYYQHNNFRIKEVGKVRNWLDAVLKSEDAGEYNISYFIVDDKSLKDINIEFLKHNYYTDVITFDYSEDNCLIGEIYISYDTVKANAKSYGYKLREEIKRVLVHGILHLLGYNDRCEEEQAIMSQKEEEKLQLYEG